MTAPKTYSVLAIGGTTFRVAIDGAVIEFQSGQIDDYGQWREDDDLEDVARREAKIPDSAIVKLPF